MLNLGTQDCVAWSKVSVQCRSSYLTICQARPVEMKEVATPNRVNRTGSGGTPPCNCKRTTQDPHPNIRLLITFIKERHMCLSCKACLGCLHLQECLISSARLSLSKCSR